jgi:diguanylate cyclase (GGDEF)-like protein/PAS domain S-box-containing protein
MVSMREEMAARIPAGLEEWVAHRLVSAHQRIVNALILGHLLNTLMLGVVFYGDAPTFGLLAIAAVLLGACIHRYVVGTHIRKGKQRINPRKAVLVLEMNTLVLACTIGTAMVWLMPGASALKQVFLAVAGTTLIAAAGYTMRTLPRAAISYILIISVCMIFGLIKTGKLEAMAACVLLGSSAVLLARMAKTAHYLFVVRILRERDANNSAETVRMLLNDYEDHGSDWLFELDREGAMVNVSGRFAKASGRTTADLNGTAFTSLFEASPERGQLSGHITERRAFRGLALALAATDASDKTWWSINGRPASGGNAGIHFRGVISDISAEKQAEARVRHMAHYDSLTGLPNRMMFTSALNRAFAEARKGTRTVLMYLDIDHFKSVNDMYGHPAGDSFLNAVAKRIQDSVETSQLAGEIHLVARLGGDEFAIMMVGQDVGDQAVRLADQLVSVLSAPYEIDGHELNSGVSIGIAIAPDHATTAQVLQSNADIALYVAKDEGRNRWEMFAPGMDVAVQERHAIERDLRLALAGNELRLFLQPLIDVETRTQTGFEALVRWEHPVRGMVMPLDFIPIAEETGLIVPIGEWVLRTAMAEAASWSDPMTIAVNLSPVQLRSANLLPTIINGLAETGLDAARLELEITESVLMHDCEANIAILNRLHALGVKIALDDFGTGYASLNYLRTFPFDKIKIDRSFVNDLDTRDDCRAIVGAVISLANQLGMKTLAEGVEHEAQLIKLREQGCEMVQGWLFGKAMPAAHYQLTRLEEEVPILAAPKRPTRRAA